MGTLRRCQDLGHGGGGGVGVWGGIEGDARPWVGSGHPAMGAIAPWRVPPLLSPSPQDTQLSTLQRLNFTIMETRCPVRSGARPDACEFKEDGVSALVGGGWMGMGSPTSRGVPSPWGRCVCPPPRLSPPLSPPLSPAHQGLLGARAPEWRPPRARRHLRGLQHGCELGGPGGRRGTASGPGGGSWGVPMVSSSPTPWCLLSPQPVRVKRFWHLVPVAIRTVAAGINLFKAIKRK